MPDLLSFDNEIDAIERELEMRDNEYADDENADIEFYDEQMHLLGYMLEYLELDNIFYFSKFRGA